MSDTANSGGSNVDSNTNVNGNTGTGGGNSGSSGDGGTGDKTLTLTQTELNKLMATNRRQLTEQNTQLMRKLEEMSQRVNMTVEEKDTLETQLQSMREQFLTAEERRTAEAERNKRASEQALQAAKAESTHWQQLFISDRMSQDLSAAAVMHEAVSPVQISSLLRHNAKVVEVLDEAGKGTGKYTTMVKIQVPDKDGRVQELSLSASDAVARMKENVTEFGNLFKSTLKSGFGGDNVAGKGGGQPSTEQLKDTNTYMKWRATQRSVKK